MADMTAHVPLPIEDWAPRIADRSILDDLARLEAGGLWDATCVAGRLARLSAPGGDPASNLAAMLRGEQEPVGGALRAWVAALGEARVSSLVELTRVRCERLLRRVSTLVDAMAPADPTWLDTLRACLRVRDDVASVAWVCRAAGPSAEVDALAHSLDAQIRDSLLALPDLPILTDPVLAAARAAEPDAWWSFDAYPPAVLDAPARAAFAANGSGWYAPFAEAARVVIRAFTPPRLDLAWGHGDDGHRPEDPTDGAAWIHDDGGTRIRWAQIDDALYLAVQSLEVDLSVPDAVHLELESEPSTPVPDAAVILRDRGRWVVRLGALGRYLLWIGAANPLVLDLVHELDEP